MHSRVRDEGCDWRSFSDDADAKDTARAGERDMLFGSSITEFIGGTQEQRKVLDAAQQAAMDPKERRVLKYLYIVKDMAQRMRLPKAITVSA